MSTGDWFWATVCLLPIVAGVILGAFFWWVEYTTKKERDRWG